MKPPAIIGLILIAIGIIGFAIGGFSFTHDKQVAQLGPLHISHQTTSVLPIPPIFTVLALAAGILLVGVSARR